MPKDQFLKTGIKSLVNLGDLTTGPKVFPLNEVIIQGPWGIKFIPGTTEMPELANLDSLSRMRFIRDLQHLKDYFDLLLIDTGTGLSRNVTDFVSSSDSAWVVTTPEPTAIIDTYAMIKVIFQQRASADIKHLLCIQHPDSGNNSRFP